MTETRKVQEIRGSYYIYLPKSWCEKNDINKKEELSIDVLEDETLLITNRNTPSPLIGKITIDLDEWTEKTEIFDLIFSCYVCGAAYIIIESKRKIDLQLRQEIDKNVRDLIDLEVLEEDENKIIIKTLGQTPEDIKNIFKRILKNVLYMLEELSLSGISSVKNNDNKKVKNEINLKEFKKSAESIISRFKDVKRFASFIERGIHMLMRNRNNLRKLKWSINDCIFNLMVTKYIESIADHCSKVAQYITKMSENAEIDPIISKFSSAAHEVYKEVISVYQFGNMIEAYKIYNNYSEFRINFADSQNNTNSNGTNLILYHLQRIISYSRRIAEIAVNKYISKTVASSRIELLKKP
ncbi:MAG: hypothetical protein GF329_12890 [Candidatus Lokiarchaeota archaeon]|nr:hypothetical protein [Candidatus Lokiarchaeota archaeon]